jgi:hypothetical protein
VKLELNLSECYAEKYSRLNKKEYKENEKRDWAIVEGIKAEILNREAMINEGLAWIQKYPQYSAGIIFWVTIGKGKDEEHFKINIWLLDPTEVDPETKADWYIEALSDGEYPFAEGVFKMSDELSKVQE